MVILNIFIEISKIILLLMKIGNKYIYLLFEIIWCSLMLISTLLFSFYGYKMVKLIFKTAKMMKLMHSNSHTSQQSISKTKSKSITSRITRTKSHNKIGEEAQIARKLSFIAIVIVLFFCIQFILTIFFINGLNINKITLIWRIIDISSHFICLIIICFMYHKTIEKLRNELNIKPLCCFSVINNMNIFKKKFKSNNTNNKLQTIQSNTAHSVLDSNSDQSTNINQTDFIHPKSPNSNIKSSLRRIPTMTSSPRSAPQSPPPLSPTNSMNSVVNNNNKNNSYNIEMQSMQLNEENEND
eukprot:408250_1